MWGAHFFCEIRAGARISQGVRIFCYTSPMASAALAQSQLCVMQQSTGHYGSHPQYSFGAVTHLATPGYTFGFPALGGGVMPPPGFQFPGAGFQAGSGLHPGRPASQDYQDYLEGHPILVTAGRTHMLVSLRVT